MMSSSSSNQSDIIGAVLFLIIGSVLFCVFISHYTKYIYNVFFLIFGPFHKEFLSCNKIKRLLCYNKKILTHVNKTNFSYQYVDTHEIKFDVVPKINYKPSYLFNNVTSTKYGVDNIGKYIMKGTYWQYFGTLIINKTYLLRTENSLHCVNNKYNMGHRVDVFLK